MKSFSAADLLSILEVGHALHPLDRALTIVAALAPDKSWDELLDMPVGEREALILAARARDFGPLMSCYAACPSCAEQWEYPLHVTDFLARARAASEREATGQRLHFCWGKYHISYRRPTSRDLSRAVSARDTESGRREILRALLVAIRKNGQFIDLERSDELPAPVWKTLGAELEARDPLLDAVIVMECATCGHVCRFSLDIAAFYWDELVRAGHALLAVVHTLASVYHWSEADILAMTAERRRWYLEMCSA